MKQKLLIFSILLLSILSCKENNKQNNITFSRELEMNIFDIKDSSYMSGFIDDVDYVKLKLPFNYFFGIIGNILFHNNDILVVDYKQAKIFRFNSEGEFLNLIGSKGNGPEDFYELSKAVIIGENIAICDISAKKMNVYSMDGSFLKSLYMSDMFRYIETLPDEKFLCFTPDYLGDNNFGLWVMNQLGEMDTVIHRYSYVYPTYSSNWNTFFHFGDKLGIVNPSLLEFYLFDLDNSEFIPWLKIVPNSKILGDFIGVDNPMNVKEEYTTLNAFAFSEKYGFILWSLSDNQSLIFSIYDIENNSIILCNYISCDVRGCNFLGLPISSNLKNGFVSIIGEDFPRAYFPDFFIHEDMDESSMILQIFKMK